MLFMLIPLLALAFLPPAPSMGGGGMLNVPVLACLIGGGPNIAVCSTPDGVGVIGT